MEKVQQISRRTWLAQVAVGSFAVWSELSFGLGRKGWGVAIGDRDFAMGVAHAQSLAPAETLRINLGFVNAYVLARMKVMTHGRWLWTRTIGSTIVGQGVDSLIFYPLAFAGIWEGETLFAVIAFNWFFKVMVEVVMTPVTYVIVGWLKRHEHEDYYDTNTDFTPFSLKD